MCKVKSHRLYTLHFTFSGLGMGCNENKVPLMRHFVMMGKRRKGAPATAIACAMVIRSLRSRYRIFSTTLCPRFHVFLSRSHNL